MKGDIYRTRYGYQVRFGRAISKHCKTLEAAERFLTGIRFKTDEGTFDARDYQKGNPLGFSNLVKKFLNMKSKTIKPKSYNAIKNFMDFAVKEWGETNIKIIGFGDIEDLLFMRENISEKSRANYKSFLHDFFAWALKRYRIPMPEFPEIKFELGWRDIISIDKQQEIIEEIKRICWDFNPKIWVGIKFLATYINIRPGELISVREKHIDLDLGAIIVPHPKEKRPKISYLYPDDIELLKQFPRALPEVYFFRHAKGNGSALPGQKFGKDYLYKWWKKACGNLGIKGIDLYGGTRHSTTTALGRFLTPEQIQDATGHTSQAFQRYFQDRQGRAISVTHHIKQLQSKQHLNNIFGGGDYRKVLNFKDIFGAEGRT